MREASACSLRRATRSAVCGNVWCGAAQLYDEVAALVTSVLDGFNVRAGRGQGGASVREGWDWVPVHGPCGVRVAAALPLCVGWGCG